MNRISLVAFTLFALAGSALAFPPGTASAAQCVRQCDDTPFPITVITQVVADKAPANTAPTEQVTLKLTQVLVGY